MDAVTQTILSDDYLSNPEAEQYIQNFYRITNAGFSLATISPIVEILKESKILQYVMKNGALNEDLSCIRHFIRSRPHLPQDFVNRFVAVVGLKINVAPSSLGLANQSYVAKITANNVRPPTLITQFTVSSMRDALREEIKNSQVVHAVARVSVPTGIKLKFNRDIMTGLVNSMSDLCKTIVEGNRLNSREIEPYIRSKIRYG